MVHKDPTVRGCRGSPPGSIEPASSTESTKSFYLLALCLGSLRKVTCDKVRGAQCLTGLSGCLRLPSLGASSVCVDHGFISDKIPYFRAQPGLAALALSRWCLLPACSQEPLWWEWEAGNMLFIHGVKRGLCPQLALQAGLNLNVVHRFCLRQYQHFSVPSFMLASFYLFMFRYLNAYILL